MELNGLDIGIIVVFLISTIIGIYRGFIRETITVIGLIIASLAAYLYGPQIGPSMTFVEGDSLRSQIGSSLVFTAVIIACFIIKLFVVKAFKLKGVKPLDRLLGIGFGLIRAIVVVVAVMLLSPSLVTKSPLYKNSMLIPKFTWIASSVDNAMPKGWNKFPDLEQLEKGFNTNPSSDPTLDGNNKADNLQGAPVDLNSIQELVAPAEKTSK